MAGEGEDDGGKRFESGGAAAATARYHLRRALDTQARTATTAAPVDDRSPRRRRTSW
jgi:hypothetical protein